MLLSRYSRRKYSSPNTLAKLLRVDIVYQQEMHGVGGVLGSPGCPKQGPVPQPESRPLAQLSRSEPLNKVLVGVSWMELHKLDPILVSGEKFGQFQCDVGLSSSGGPRKIICFFSSMRVVRFSKKSPGKFVLSASSWSAVLGGCGGSV